MTAGGLSELALHGRRRGVMMITRQSSPESIRTAWQFSPMRENTPSRVTVDGWAEGEAVGRRGAAGGSRPAEALSRQV